MSRQIAVSKGTQLVDDHSFVGNIQRRLLSQKIDLSALGWSPECLTGGISFEHHDPDFELDPRP
jgi:hypothetical protein